MTNTPHIQLTKEQIKYLLELIIDMDNDTVYTARQRAYTVPKLTGMLDGTFDRKLMFKDVSYLIELIEDDEVPSPYRNSTYDTLIAIQKLQSERFQEYANIDEQRNKRRIKRIGMVDSQKGKTIK